MKMLKTAVRLLLVSGFAVAAGFFLFDGAQAAASLQISQIECGQPEHAGQFDLVHIQNSGDVSQDLAGWQLRSDPEGSEQMSLGVAGSVDPGETVFIVAGAHGVNLPSENLFLWSNVAVLRDGDAGDYAKLVDPSGNAVSGLNCLGQPVVTAPVSQPQQQQQTQQPQQEQTQAQTSQNTGAAAAPRGKGPRAIPAAGGPASDDAGLPLIAVTAGLMVSLGATALALAGSPQPAATRRKRR
jgi:hypothetical protein